MAETKTIVLIVSADEQNFKRLSQLVGTVVKTATIFTAHDGGEASAKIANALPQILITDSQIEKISAFKVVENLFGRAKGKQHVAAVILSAIPDKEHFVDEVVSGKVTFVEEFNDDSKVKAGIVRAMDSLQKIDGADFKHKFVNPGDVLLKEGEKATSVFLVRSGTLKAVLLRDNKETVLGKIETGEFVGEMAYINGQPRSATVIAETTSELIEIPIGALDHILFQKPSWSKALMQTLTKRLSVANSKK